MKITDMQHFDNEVKLTLENTEVLYNTALHMADYETKQQTKAIRLLNRSTVNVLMQSKPKLYRPQRAKRLQQREAAWHFYNSKQHAGDKLCN